MSAHIAKHSRKILETSCGPEQMLVKAVAKGKFPARRFRVEGSAYGSSHLLNANKALRTCARYGGQIVEVVTKAMFLTAQAKELKLPTCVRKSCAARTGEPCKNKSGVCAPHACRLAQADPAEAAEKLLSCPIAKCPALGGQPCMTRKGTPRMPHKARLAGAPS
jgi:hypothetical protein